MKRKVNVSPGFWFVLPWIIGFVFFFLQPIVQLVQMSFSDFALTAEGMKLLPLEDKWEHFVNAVRTDANFPVFLTDSLAKLPCGVAAVYQNEWIQPILCKVDKYSGKNKKFEYTISPEDASRYEECTLYAINFDNYIAPVLLGDGKYLFFADYEDQLVEAEARAFAKLFTKEGDE